MSYLVIVTIIISVRGRGSICGERYWVWSGVEWSGVEWSGVVWGVHVEDVAE